MPVVTTNASILNAAQNAIEILLRFKGIDVVVNRRGILVEKPGGGHEPTPPHALASQKFAITQLGADIVEDGADGDTPVVKRNYALTGRLNADLRVDDTFEDDEAKYRVVTVNAESGYKTSAEVVGFVKGP